MRRLAVLLLLPSVMLAQSWRTESVAAESARVRGDWSEYKRHLRVVYDSTSGSPRALVAMARAEVGLRDTTAALELLRDFAGMGLVRDLTNDPSFANLRALPSWNEVTKRIEGNRRTVARATKAFTLGAPDDLAEDMTYDPATRTFFVSSIRYRKIVAIDRAGKESDFVTEGRDGVWGILAVAVDAPRRVLWATTAAMPQSRTFSAADSGRSAVLKYDLSTGKLIKRYDLPVDHAKHVMGDMVLTPQGDAFISDAVTGIVYAIRRDRDSLNVLVGNGVFISPQEPAVAADGRLFVPDYVRGIAIVDPSSGAVTWLAHAPNVALSGIDGLTFAGPTTLLIVQNGTDPRRVVSLELDQARRRVLRATVLEASLDEDPTHGVMADGDFYFIGNSGWGSFDDDGPLKAGAKPVFPLVKRLPQSVLRAPQE
ncbi:MAG: hypothetical protein M3081_08300 [Gemmatimonadota bacterium]|nr:hypothetical protein [Gemmatimonadota bacterium]